MKLESIGGRRFLLVCAVGLGSSVLLWFGKLTPDAWASAMNWSVAAYIAGNVSQRHIEAKREQQAPGG